MEERKLTVYYGRGAFKEAPPQMTERAGFTTGDKITVKCRQGHLVIIKDEPEPDIEMEK